MNSPPARRGSLFTGAPARRGVLEGGGAPRLVAGGAYLFRQRGDRHFLAGPLDARAGWLRVGPPVGPLLGRLVVVVLLVALGAAAQASGGVEISGGGGSGTHDCNFSWFISEAIRGRSLNSKAPRRLSSGSVPEFLSFRHPCRSFLEQLPVRADHPVGAFDATPGEPALQHHDQQVDQVQRAHHRRSPRPFG